MRKRKHLNTEQLELRTLPVPSLTASFVDGLFKVDALESPELPVDRTIQLAFLNGELVITDVFSVYQVSEGTKPTAANVVGVLINGSTGNDFIDPRAIGAAFTALASPVTINGGDGLDQIYTPRRSCNVNGGLGDDVIFGESGYVHNDVLIGGDGRDTIVSTAGDDFVDGGNGNDIISTAGGNDTIYGGAGNDRLFGGIGQDLILGQGGHDLIFAEDGDDIVQGGTGDDSIHGGYGSDTLSGLDGNDLMRGGAGDDSLTGGDGNDWLDGDQGSDTLSGGWGDDTLYGDSGSDTMTGGQGTDYRSSLEWGVFTDVFLTLTGPLNVGW